MYHKYHKQISAGTHNEIPKQVYISDFSYFESWQNDTILYLMWGPPPRSFLTWSLRILLS